MKLDVEVVLKYRFWLILLLVPIFVVGSVFLLMTVVRADINRERKKIEETVKKVKGSPGVHNDKTVDAKKREADDFKAAEKEAWIAASKEQGGLMTWPEAFERKFPFRDGLFAVDITLLAKDTKPEERKEDDGKYQGVITDLEQNWIKVQGKDKQILQFYRTTRVEKIKSQDPSRVFFTSLNRGDVVDVVYERSKYFNDPLTSSEQREFIKYYINQVDEVISQVQPMSIKGEGVVQLKGWFYKKDWINEREAWPKGKFLSYVEKWQEGADISEEAWLAQEDIWIQREIYRLLRLANDYVGEFKGQGGSDKNKPHTFTNPNWEFKVAWNGKDELTIDVKNLLDRRQKLDQNFLFKLHKTQPAEECFVGGVAPIDPQLTAQIKVALTPNQQRTGVYGIGQMLTWETAAVKRIDAVSIGVGTSGGAAMPGMPAPGGIGQEDGSHSNRTVPLGVVPLKKPEQAPGVVDPTAAANPFATVLPNAAPAGNAFPPLRKERYVEVAPQARRLPVAVALIVDQDHVDRVLTAFGNSKLRLLITQVILNRYPMSVRPQLPALSATGPGFFQPSPADGGPGTVSVSDPETSVELVIYGTVSLYERYPPRPISVEAAPGKLP